MSSQRSAPSASAGNRPPVGDHAAANGSSAWMTSVVSVTGPAVAARSTAWPRRHSSTNASARNVAAPGTSTEGSSSWSATHRARSSSTTNPTAASASRACSPTSSPFTPRESPTQAKCSRFDSIGGANPSSSSARTTPVSHRSHDSNTRARASATISPWIATSPSRTWRFPSRTRASACAQHTSPRATAASTSGNQSANAVAVRRRPWDDPRGPPPAIAA